MDQQTTDFCGECARASLASWQGWPDRNPIPTLPKIIAGACESCGGTSSLPSSRIRWFNYHGEYNTGLPDYWLLEIDGERVKWGFPYFAEAACAKCGEPATVSQMCFPNGTTELKTNCRYCGLRTAR